MKKLIAVIASITLLVVLFVFYTDSSSPSDTQALKRHKRQIEHEPVPIADTPDKQAEDQAQTRILSPNELWGLSEHAEVALKKINKLPPDLKGEAYLEINLERLRELKLGEHFSIDIPQVGETYTGEVDFITQHESGSVTIEAAIPGLESIYMALITVGKNGAFGNLNLPSGAYVMQSRGNYAWIASRKDLESNHKETLPAKKTSPNEPTH